MAFSLSWMASKLLSQALEFGEQAVLTSSPTGLRSKPPVHSPCLCTCCFSIWDALSSSLHRSSNVPPPDRVAQEGGMTHSRATRRRAGEDPAGEGRRKSGASALACLSFLGCRPPVSRAPARVPRPARARASSRCGGCGIGTRGPNRVAGSGSRELGAGAHLGWTQASALEPLRGRGRRAGG